MWLMFLALGTAGFFAMSWLFILAAKVSSTKHTLPCEPGRAAEFPNSVAILIPAHNEAHTLPRTLVSIHQAIAALQAVEPGIAISLLVGADGCTDKTETIARDALAKVVSTPSRCGKWRTIEGLLANCPATDWVILADAGVIWPSHFLVRTLAQCDTDTVMGIAPSYRIAKSGLLEQLSWFFERHLKALESKLGGPVSVHGATVVYERHALLRAMEWLWGVKWLNDDIAIPLAMRLLNPSKSLVYDSNLIVTDYLDTHPTKKANEYLRRKRMVQGNIQWVSNLLIPAFRHNPVAAWLSIRRIARIFWAYWLMSILVGVGGLAYEYAPSLTIAKNIQHSLNHPTLWLAGGSILMILGLLLFLSCSVPKLFAVAKASLLAPYLLLDAPNSSSGPWR